MTTPQSEPKFATVVVRVIDDGSAEALFGALGELLTARDIGAVITSVGGRDQQIHALIKQARDAAVESDDITNDEVQPLWEVVNLIEQIL